MKESKKEWVTPELIVLVRSKQEEAVLAACKRIDLSGAVNDSYTHCLVLVCGVTCVAYAAS
jgi:hypothetical protein